MAMFIDQQLRYENVDTPNEPWADAELLEIWKEGRKNIKFKTEDIKKIREELNIKAPTTRKKNYVQLVKKKS